MDSLVSELDDALELEVFDCDEELVSLEVVGLTVVLGVMLGVILGVVPGVDETVLESVVESGAAVGAESSLCPEEVVEETEADILVDT